MWLVPVYRHAFEDVHDKVLASFADRVGWCEAMARDLGPGCAVSEVESELPTPSYSIDTLRFLAARFPKHEFRLVVGADVLPHVHAWRDWEGIVAEFKPIVVGRGSYPPPVDQASLDFPDVSSSDIRRRHRLGQPVDHLLTSSVCAALDAWKGAW